MVKFYYQPLWPQHYFLLLHAGKRHSNNASTIASITNESSAVSTVNGEVPYTFFDDAVFVGDSVSLKLNLYVSAQRKMTMLLWELRNF